MLIAVCCVAPAVCLMLCVAYRLLFVVWCLFNVEMLFAVFCSWLVVRRLYVLFDVFVVGWLSLDVYCLLSVACSSLFGMVCLLCAGYRMLYAVCCLLLADCSLLRDCVVYRLIFVDRRLRFVVCWLCAVC